MKMLSMKTHLYYFPLLITLSCAPDKKEEITSDSTRVATDSVVSTETATIVPVSSPAVAAPTITIYRKNFPLFSEEPLTENDLEISTTQSLAEMLKRYDEGEYNTIKKQYSIYSESNNLDRWEMQRWYFDTENHLKAYTRGYKNQMESNIDQTTIYLFSSDSSGVPALAAVYNNEKRSERKMFSSKKRTLTSKLKERIITSNCPQCGVSLSLDFNPTTKYQVSVVDQARITELSKTFFEEYDALFKRLKETEMTQHGNYSDYLAKEELKQGEKTYNVNYTIHYSVYEKVVMANP